MLVSVKRTLDSQALGYRVTRRFLINSEHIIAVYADYYSDLGSDTYRKDETEYYITLSNGKCERIDRDSYLEIVKILKRDLIGG